MNKVTVLFFASLKDKLGTDRIEFDMSQSEISISELIHQLKLKGEVWQESFESPQLMMAVNHDMVQQDDKLIKGGDEIAFFPPVTGG